MPATADAVQDEIDGFLDRVLTDGRFIGEFHERPTEIAETLGVELSVGAATQVKTAKPEETLDHFFETRFATEPGEEYQEGSPGQQEGSPGQQEGPPGQQKLAAPAAVVAVGIGAGIAAVVVVTGVLFVIDSNDPEVVDHSPDRDNKV